MSPATQTEKEPSHEVPLPRRDWVLLPLISLFTICTILVAAGIISLRLLPHRPRGKYVGIGSCAVFNEAVGQHGIPSTTCLVYEKESGAVEYKFNNCGHRTAQQCGMRTEGAFRIVMMGSSIPMGLKVRQDATIGAHLPEEIEKQSGQRIDLYNTAFCGGTPHVVAQKFDEVMRAKPDMILWIITSFDIAHVSAMKTFELAIGTEPMRKTSFSGLQQSLEEVSEVTRFTILRALYGNESLHLQMSLLQPDEEIGFLRKDPSQFWKESLSQVEGYAGGMIAKAKEQGIPFVVVMVPNRAHAEMLSMGNWSAEYDPYRLGAMVNSSITRLGGVYLDILPEFSRVPDAGFYYHVVDPHPNVQGYPLIAHLIAEKILANSELMSRITDRRQIVSRN